LVWDASWPGAAAPPVRGRSARPRPRPLPLLRLRLSRPRRRLPRRPTLFRPSSTIPSGSTSKASEDLDLGHLEQARAAFNRAIDVLLSAPGGARTEPRLRAQFDKLVDRISALEVASLATGDGFAEKPTEPASLDQLLAMSDTLTDAVPTRAVAATVQTDLAETEHDIPIPQNEKVLAYVELFQGRLRGFIQEGLDRGGQYLPMIQNVFRAEGLPLDLATCRSSKARSRPTRCR
jgi:membrane-bound lytic murein transglycosylase D